MPTTYSTIIIGAGISGLTVAHRLRHLNKQHSLLVIEQNESIGGAVNSHIQSGYLAEKGPHGFLDNCQESQDILKETGLDLECVKAPLSKFVRYVCLGNKLRLIPQTPGKIIRAPLISPFEKLRVPWEIFKKPLSGEPTVSQWVEYRFGKALLPFADAVFTGTYAGDIDRLKMDAVMPGVRKLEMENGSLIRGLLAKRKAAKKNNNKSKKTLPAMTSFPTGMQRLPQRLAEDLQPDLDIKLNCQVSQFQATETGWQVQSTAGTFQCDNLVLATPVNTCLSLLESASFASPVPSIPEARIATIAFGFGPGASLPPGFGYLTPEQEKRFCLGALFSSNMFAGRAPEGHILLEALVGGRRHPEKLELTDQELIEKALADIGPLLNLPAEPTFSQVLRPSSGIPQLEEDYPRLLAWRNALVEKEKGLAICGFGWDGIGLNDMMKTASRAADAIHEGSGENEQEAEVKGVYF